MSTARLTKIAVYGAVASITGAFVLHHYTQAKLASGEYYQLTTDAVRRHMKSNDVLGGPLRFTYMNLGRRDIRITEENAMIVIPVKGSKRSGNVFSKSTKIDDRWQLQMVEIEVNESGEKRIRVLPDETI
ncbi:uncharacterized protein LOC124453151 [Xenia sp. Carnegie-2017]|uniref:uncharacterized protein LOC124453151 n=1 Tax=Xenia sp. Carnegie-2017 TaxID=2897299 RepID=UPI001F036FC1|nr:uncharacterized protein LOC124453151 [Xenia sp. Carnegie-2017]